MMSALDANLTFMFTLVPHSVKISARSAELLMPWSNWLRLLTMQRSFGGTEHE
jgi:hypothetical protein